MSAQLLSGGRWRARWLLCCLVTVVSGHAAAASLPPAQNSLLQGALMRGCLKRTPASDGVGMHPADKVNRYCQCASRKLAEDISAEEVMGVLSGQIRKDDPRGKQKMAKAKAACANYLE